VKIASSEESRVELFRYWDFDEVQRKHDHLGIGSALDWCRDRRDHWHEVLSEYCRRIGVDAARLPSAANMIFDWTAPSEAASWTCAEGGTMRLHVPYAIVAKEAKYDETIAHETVHHFQQHVFPREGESVMHRGERGDVVGNGRMLRKTDSHGEMFYLLYHLGCGMYHRPHTHNYDCKSARRLAPLLAQHAKMLRLTQSLREVRA